MIIALVIGVRAVESSIGNLKCNFAIFGLNWSSAVDVFAMRHRSGPGTEIGASSGHDSGVRSVLAFQNVASFTSVLERTAYSIRLLHAYFVPDDGSAVKTFGA